MIIKSLGKLEVDYEKKEVRTEGSKIGFGRISHYVFEYGTRHETMRVNGTCDEINDFSPDEEKSTTLFDVVELKLWFYYYQNGELKESSLDFLLKDAFEARRKLKPLITYLRNRDIDEYNMFVGREHLRIGKLVSLNISSQEFEAALHQWRKDGGVLPRFGECSVHRVDILATVGHVRIVTRKMSEEEMLPLLEYMKQSMPMEPYYDDHGYGVIPKPHEVRLFWPLPQGEVYMTWDGFNYTRGDEPNHPQGDGLDCITIELWDCARLRQSRDEEYWRSEVD